jgi:hypothetical protein
MSPEEPIITFRTYFDPMLAQIERSRLEDNDIPCFIADENIAVMNPLYNTAIGGIKLKIFKCDLERCNAILTDEGATIIDETVEVTPEATDTVLCPYCGSANVRYGDATQKKYGVLSMNISFLFMALPFYSRKAWHCFNCGKDFESPTN